MTLRTRKPSGRVPWPLILVEGAEKAGKSWAAAELSASAKVGQTYWIDLGEGSADEYGAIPNARYLIVEHDGSFGQILQAVEDVRDLAAKAQANGQPPVVLVIDTMTAVWELLSTIADRRARDRAAKKGRRVAADEDVQIGMDLWNEANTKHRRLMTVLMTFPGIVVVTARGREVAQIDGNGRPVEGRKSYRVEGQKNLAFDATVWIRVSREEHPLVVGARSVKAGIRPGVDRPRTMPDLTLERVVFDVLGCDPATATPRTLVDGTVTEQDLADPPTERAKVLEFALDAATTKAEMRAVYAQISAALGLEAITDVEAKRLGAKAEARAADLPEAAMPEQQTIPLPTDGPPPSDRAMRRMYALFREVNVAGPDQHEVMSRVTGREITSAKQLTSADVDSVMIHLDQVKVGLRAQ